MWCFSKFNFKLKVSAFYLDNKKRFIPKKDLLSLTAKIDPKDGACYPNFQWRFWFWPKWLLGRKQILVPVLVYVSKSDWMLNQLTSKSVLHNDNSPKRYLISNFFFTYFMYLTFVFLLLFLYHLCIAVTIFNFLKAKSDLWVLFCTSIMVCEI